MRTQPFVPPPPPKTIVVAAAPAAPTETPRVADAPVEPARTAASPPARESQPPSSAPEAQRDAPASPLQNFEQVLLKQLADAQAQPPATGLRLESDLFVFTGTRNEPEASPLLACLYLGLLDTRRGMPWELHTPEGMPLLVMNEQRQLDGDPEYVRFFQRFERIMLLEHLTSISVTISQLRGSIPENARKSEVLALLDKEVLRINKLLEERFK